jgi:hypothetical protein
MLRNNHARLTALLCALFLCNGLAEARGSKVQTHTSDFDGSTEGSVDPHGTDCGFKLFGILMGGAWTTTAPAQVQFDIGTINHYASITGAALSLDGQIVELQQASVADHHHDGYGALAVRESNAQFRATLEVLRQIVAARQSMVRLMTPQGYEECYLRRAEKPAGSLAYDALARLLTAIDAQPQPSNAAAR